MKDLLDKLRTYKKPVLGIAVSAFTRTGPAFLLPNYGIICLQDTSDLEAIRKKCKVYCLESDFGIDLAKLKKQNTSSIMKIPQVSSLLKSLGKGTSLLVYKSTNKVEKICHKLGIKVLASPCFVRDPFEDKKEFRVLGKKAGLRMIPGETLLIDDFNANQFEVFKRKYGTKLVFQLPDYKIGGGIGTFFVKTRDEWREFKAFVSRRRTEGKALIWVNVTKYITGTAGSITGCVTKNGVLCGLVQTQLIDIPEATAFKGRSGVWCGHDWGFKQFSTKIQRGGEKLCRTLGQFMGQKGYKGVFGIDLAIDEKNEEVWPVECNSRYTGAFPVYSMMQDIYGEPSFDVFHLLEYLEIDYKVDLAKIQEMYRQPKAAAHVIMHNQERKWVKIGGEVKGGVYKFEKGKLVWQRPGFSLQDLQDREEFCLVERAPYKAKILKPGERLVRVLFKDKIALSSNKLNDWASAVCKKIYRAYQLQPIPSRTKKKS